MSDVHINKEQREDSCVQKHPIQVFGYVQLLAHLWIAVSLEVSGNDPIIILLPLVHGSIKVPSQGCREDLSSRCCSWSLYCTQPHATLIPSPELDYYQQLLYKRRF